MWEEAILTVLNTLREILYFPTLVILGQKALGDQLSSIASRWSLKCCAVKGMVPKVA